MLWSSDFSKVPVRALIRSAYRQCCKAVGRDAARSDVRNGRERGSRMQWSQNRSGSGNARFPLDFRSIIPEYDNVLCKPSVNMLPMLLTGMDKNWHLVI
eukprot:IDg17428t1